MKKAEIKIRVKAMRKAGIPERHIELFVNSMTSKKKTYKIKNRLPSAACSPLEVYEWGWN